MVNKHTEIQFPSRLAAALQRVAGGVPLRPEVVERALARRSDDCAANAIPQVTDTEPVEVRA